MARRRYAIIGVGAIGGYYGGRLAEAGHEVHFLARSNAPQLREQGLRVDSVDGDFSLTPSQYTVHETATDIPPCDVVIVALKATSNAILPGILPGMLAEDGDVALFQNGLGLEAELASAVGDGRVIGGLCFICSNRLSPNHISHLDYGRVMLGRYHPEGKPAGIDPRLRQLGDDLQEAKIPVVLADDLLEARWRKLVWNIPYNGLSVVLDAQTDELMKDPHTRDLVEALMWEVLTDCHAATGRAIPPSFLMQMLDDTLRMKPYRTSMKLDCDHHEPMEVEAIFGNPLRAAKAAGADSPLIEMLYRQLKFIDARNRAQ